MLLRVLRGCTTLKVMRLGCTHSPRTATTVRLLALAVLMWTVVGCAPAPPLVRVGYAAHDHHAPLFIAAALGPRIAGPTGTHLREIEYRSGYQLIRAGREIARLDLGSSTGAAQLVRHLAEDHFDLIFGGVPAMLQSIAAGNPIEIVSPVNVEGAALVVAAHLPIDSWDAFLSHLHNSPRTVRIAYREEVSVQNIILERALAVEGVEIAYGIDAAVDPTKPSVRMINVYGVANLLPAMAAGVVDGFVSAQPYPAMAEVHGVGRIVVGLEELPPAGRWRQYPCCAIAVRNGVIGSVDPVVLRELLSVFAAAGEFIRREPIAAAAEVARWLGTDPVVEERSLPTIGFLGGRIADWERGVAIWREELGVTSPRAAE